MKKLARPYWIATLLIALSALLGVAALRAAAQSVMGAPPTRLQAAEAPDTHASPPPAPAPARPAGVIRDDPTVAPDKSQSADNNVSFPVDI